MTSEPRTDRQLSDMVQSLLNHGHAGYAYVKIDDHLSALRELQSLRSAREAEPVGILVPDGEDGLEPLWYEGTNVSEGDELYLHPSPSTEGLGVRACPFCGSSAKLIRPMGERVFNKDENGKAVPPYFGEPWFRFVCGDADCHCSGRACGTEAEALSYWNRRAPTISALSTSVEQVERKSDPQDAIHELYLDALAEAEKAMRKFPQPNYVISKVAEEAGEVVKAAIHCAEGRDTHLVGEIRQAMAMLIRLYVEGDQVHGLSSPRAALSPIPDTQVEG